MKKLVPLAVVLLEALAGYCQMTIHVPQDLPTIQAGIDAATSGDTVLVAAGTYLENLDFKGKGIIVTSGAADATGANAAVILAASAGPVVTMHSGEPVTATLNGFTITHISSTGVQTDGDGVAIYNASGTITNNIITGVAFCAIGAAKAPTLLIKGNRITGNISHATNGQCSFESLVTTQQNSIFTLAFEQCGDLHIIGNVISGNAVDDSGGGGSSNLNAFLIIDIANSLVFQDNVYSGNRPDGFISIFAVPTISFIQNLIYGNVTNGAPAVSIQSITTVGQIPVPATVVITNNTVYGNTFSGPTGPSTSGGLQFSLSQGNQELNGSISNNIFENIQYQAVSCGIHPPSTLTFSHNDVYSPGYIQSYQCTASPGQTIGNISANPQFLSVSSNDLHANPSSPVVAAGDIGAPLIPPADFDGKNRTVCGTIDMGAYEVHPHPPISLSSSPNPSVGGSPVTFTIRLSGNCNVPTGLVTLLDGQTPIGTAALDSSGNTVFTTSALLVGTHQITATYPGDFNFENSTSNTVQQVVTGYPSVTSLQVSPNPASAFQAITFTSTVTSQFGAPTGTVSFYAGNNLLATAPISALGLASTSLNTLGVGVYNITAVYNASVNFAGSTSPIIVETVVGAATATSLSSSPNPSSFGQGVTFTATVKAPQSSLVPVGTVNFREGSSILGSAVLNSAGVAVFTTSLLAVGSHTIAADYTGSPSDNPSTSNTTIQIVQPISTSVTLIGNPNPAALGQTVTLTATASPVGNVTVPAGSITFADQFGTLGTVPLTNGQAVFTTNSLTTGIHNIIATFAATGNFAGAASPVLAELIQSFDFSVTLSPASLTLARGGQGQVTVQLTSVGNLSGNVTLQASQVPMYATLGFSPASVTFAAGGSGSSLLSIDTVQAPPHALLDMPSNHSNGSLLTFAALLAAPLLFLRRRRVPQALCSFLLMAGLMAVSGCTNIFYPLNRVAPGTYSIPITATDTTTNITHTAILTLIVTP